MQGLAAGLQLPGHGVGAGAVVVDPASARIRDVGEATGDEVEGVEGLDLLFVVAVARQARGSLCARREAQEGEADGVARAINDDA